MSKKRIIMYSVATAVAAAVIAIACVLYSRFASDYVFKESENHLTEIYNQIGATLEEKLNGNWRNLRMWTDFIDDNIADDERLDEFIEKAKTEYEFNEFYFLAENDSAMRIGSDKTTNLSLGQVDFSAPFARESYIRDADGNNIEIIVFAVPYSGTYKNKELKAIAVSYDAELLSETLARSVKAFAEDGYCFAADNSGRILITSKGLRNTKERNFFAFLRGERLKMTDKTMSQLEEDWAVGNRDVVLFKYGREEFYMCYKPIAFSNWKIVGVIPSVAMNSAISSFRAVTILVVVVLFVLLAGILAVFLILAYRRNIKVKNAEISSRENLMDMFTFDTNDLYILFSPDTFVADYVSSNIERVLGISKEEVSKDIHAVLACAEEKHAAFTSAGLKSLSYGNAFRTDIAMTNVETGEKYWFRMALYRSQFNGKDSFALIFIDYTSDHHMRDELSHALAIAKSANAAKSNFLSNMSHDIRTPMNAIVGFATLLAKDADKPDRVREYIRKISFSSQHLLSLINDILDMSKIESGKTTLNIEEFALPEFLEELYAIMAPQAKARNHELKVVTKGNLPSRIAGDKLRLNQVLINLLSNAVKYTPDGGKIELRIELLDELVANHAHLRMTVKDNGIGMSDEFVREIFEPFSREETAETKGIQGTGLGMAIVKNVVDLMGGTISVESELGAGSRFIVELNLAVAERKTGHDGDFWKENHVTRVLVVDDEEDICIGVKDVMEDTGVEIDYALSGIQAVAKVSEKCEANKDYNVILLDWKMPEMDGVETARNIRKIVGRRVPIIVLTSYNFDDVEEKARDAGVDAFLSKPFFLSNFRNAIETIKNSDVDKITEIKPEPISLAGLKILAAEDNEINAEILVDLLDMEGAECDIACNGKEALERFETAARGRYDLIFMDVQMPVMNGYEATKAIRACGHPEAKTIPIIAMTANAFADDIKDAISAGMNAHVSKPVDMDKLKQAVRELRSARD